MDDDRIRWDERYAGAPIVEPRAPDVIAASADVRAVLPAAGRALDVACGAGGQTVWMAEQGLEVIALDVSPAAIRLTEGAASARGLADRVDARVHDLDAGLPADAVDLALVLCQRFRAPALYRELAARLAPGGLAIVTVLSQVGLDVDPGPFHAPPGELIDAFRDAGCEVIHHCEAAGQASIAIRR